VVELPPAARRLGLPPQGRGVLEVTGGGFVLFSLTGMSSLTSGSGVHMMTFQTADATHGWLNDVIALGEGSIDPDRGPAGHALLRLRPGLPAGHRAAGRSVTAKPEAQQMPG
jgi:hypothetical protein